MATPLLFLDGGLGTTLEAPPHNVHFTAETPLWSSHLLLTDPTTLRNVHTAFVDAGADIILTATYQTSIAGFQHTDSRLTHEDAANYMRSAIPLARDAFHGRPESESGSDSKTFGVAISLGPYGATMSPVSTEYTGLYPAEMDSESALRKWHAERLGVFTADAGKWEDGVDFVAFETVKRVDEVRAIRGAVRDVFAGGSVANSRPTADHAVSRKPWWITGVFPAEQVDESEVREWVRAALSADEDENNLPRPWGVGLNCTRIGNVQPIVQIMENELHRLVHENRFVDEWAASRSHRPWLVLYPDGTKGERYDPATKQWVKKEEVQMTRPWEDIYADVVEGVRAQGTSWEGVIAGGCCRTGPGEIAALKRSINGST